MKRILLFLLTNILVVMTISIAVRLLGVDRYLTANGIDYANLAIFCLIWGSAGSFISLLLSKSMAKWTMGVQVVDKSSPQFSWLVNMIEQLANKSGLPVTPEVGIYESPEVNAFATGPSKRNSIVAFSTGLLQSMSRDEIEGVAGHEITHIQNGDMVTMTLLQGIVNAFALFLSRVIGFAIAQSSRDSDRGPVVPPFLLTFVLEIVFTLLGSIVVCAFSRWREYRADYGSARIAGKQDMISALERLRSFHDRVDTSQAAVAAFKIDGRQSTFLSLFATHPPLEKRIAALQAAQV